MRELLQAEYHQTRLQLLTIKFRLLMAKQVCDIKSTKGIAAADSKEQTRSWTEKQMTLRLANKDLNYDFTRSHLNFEVVDGEIKEVDKRTTLDDSIRENLKRRGIPHPDDSQSHVKKGTKEPEKMKRNIAARIILGGSTARMNQIAFGDQIVNFKRGSDNSHIQRTEDIERWAKQEYEWLQSMFGKDNVARFIVHLDETGVHAHATVIPTGIIKGKERVSWRTVFGGSLDVSRPKWKRILDEHYNMVGKNWGLDRGEPVKITGAQNISTRDYNKELKKENAQLSQKNGVLHQQYEQLSNEHADLIRQTDEARGNLKVIADKVELLTREMGRHMKAMKSLTSMVENKMAQRNVAIQTLQQAQTQRNSGLISIDEYETIVQETNSKIDDFDSFIKQKTDSLTTIGTHLMEKQNELAQLHTDYDTLLKEVEVAKKFKKENDGLFKRFSSYIDNTLTERTLLDVAKRLSAIPDGEKVEGLAGLAKVLKIFADSYPEKIKEAQQNGYDQGYRWRNAEIEPDIEELRKVAEALGGKVEDTQNKDLSALARWLMELTLSREEELKAEGMSEAIKKIRKSSGRNWSDEKLPSPEKLGQWYKNYKGIADDLHAFEKENGSLSSIKETMDDYKIKVKQRDSKIDNLRCLMPTLDKAISAIISLFHNTSQSLSFSMEEAEHIWRILSMADTKEQCVSMANQLVDMARKEDKGLGVPETWINEAAQCVLNIAEHVNPLAAVFALVPSVTPMGGGGGGNNDLPRKKNDDDKLTLFHTIMGTKSRGRKI